MINNNSQKKKIIDDILAKYNTEIAVIKQRRDKIISEFLEILNKKKLEELRKQIKQL